MRLPRRLRLRIWKVIVVNYSARVVRIDLRREFAGKHQPIPIAMMAALVGES